MADDKKASPVERKPSPLQPVCLMCKECFEPEEQTLTYVLEHIMFLQDFMDIKTLVVQKSIKLILDCFLLFKICFIFVKYKI